MHISLTNIGKKYNRNWVFENVNIQFEPNSHSALLGANGSGKSTLLQIISGHIVPTIGQVSYSYNKQNLDINNIYQHIAYCAPHFELVEELSIAEFLNYHFKHKPCISHVDDILKYINLSSRQNTLISNCSSGMKQRVKLAQAFFSDVPVLLLDEPCTNLDTQGVALYQQMVNELGSNKTIIVSSNEPNEYDFCEQKYQVSQFNQHAGH